MKGKRKLIVRKKENIQGFPDKDLRHKPSPVPKEICISLQLNSSIGKRIEESFTSQRRRARCRGKILSIEAEAKYSTKLHVSHKGPALKACNHGILKVVLVKTCEGDT